jgi:hypothetical protein
MSGPCAYFYSSRLYCIVPCSVQDGGIVTLHAQPHWRTAYRYELSTIEAVPNQFLAVVPVTICAYISRAATETVSMEMLRFEPIVLDRVSQTCRGCGTGTHITAAYLGVTRVMLETTCPACGWTSSTCFDLLKLDTWMQDPNPNAPLPDGAQFSCDKNVLSGTPNHVQNGAAS